MRWNLHLYRVYFKNEDDDVWVAADSYGSAIAQALDWSNETEFPKLTEDDVANVELIDTTILVQVKA